MSADATRKMATLFDLRCMERAIALSRRGYPAPNPHVGCVLAREERIVGEGFHAYAGGDHAEVAALRQAGAAAQGATAYVTLEPCNHYGRTGPCTIALINCGVRRVVYAVEDPNPRADGGSQRLLESGVEVESGVLAEAATQANLKFLTAHRLGRAYVILKAAVSLDGRLALANGASRWLTGDKARRQAHQLRAEAGAVMVGRGTIAVDDPELTVRAVRVRNQPLRIVLDPRRSLGPDHKVFQGPAQYRIFSQEDFAGRFRFSAKEIAEQLFAEGCTSVLVEGGARTLSRFVDEGVFDRLELIVSPKLLGNGPAWFQNSDNTDVGEAAVRFRSVRRLGSDLWLTAYPASFGH